MNTYTLAIVGGGVAGLAAAVEAKTIASAGGLPLQIVLVEASERLGGKVRTESLDDGRLEWGPDAFLAAKPAARELAERLGLAAELVSPGPEASKTYLWLGGRLRRLPPGLVMGVPAGARPLLNAVREGVVTPLQAARAAMEPLLAKLPRTQTSDDETIADTMSRRLGRGVTARLVAPLVSGVYGAPIGELATSATLPQFAGPQSLVLSMSKRPKPSGPTFLSFRGGMGRLVQRMAEELEHAEVHTALPATSLTHDGGSYNVATPEGDIRADAVVVATPAPAAAALLTDTAPHAARALVQIRYRPTIVAHLRYRPEALGRSLDGSGFLVVPGEGMVVAAGSWVGTKWPHLELTDALLRVVVNAPDAVTLPVDALQRRIVEDVSTIMQASGPPEQVRLVRWPEAMPVYAPGHLARVEAVEANLPEGVQVAGAAYRGVGVPDCIATGQKAARRLVESLSARTGSARS